VLVTQGAKQLAGIVVGASRLPGGSAYAVQYAQDLHSIEQNVLLGFQLIIIGFGLVIVGGIIGGASAL